MPMSEKSHTRASRLAESIESERLIWWPFLTTDERTAFEQVRDTFNLIAAGRRDHLASE